jgi:integrase
VIRKGPRGTAYALRFRAYGERQYVTLGRAEDGWTERRAEAELANVLADVRRGIWRPPTPEPKPSLPTRDPSFHEFASEWLAALRPELRETTIVDYEWQLTHHLLPFFAGYRLAQIGVEDVDRYRRAKVAEGRLSAASINKTITRLAQIMEQAVEYGLVERNPARGKRRQLKTATPPRLHLEPEQVAALLDAAGELDAEDRLRNGSRRALLATLAYAGLRVGELTALRWRDVDLAGGAIRVREAKTDAGVRTVDVQPELRDELVELRARARFDGPDDLVFGTRTGRQQNRNNIRRRILLRAVARANERIAERGGSSPLPEGLSPHALRRSFASWLIAEGEDPAYVMAQSATPTRR